MRVRWHEPKRWLARSTGVEHPEGPARTAGHDARPTSRKVVAGVLTGAAALLVLVALTFPDQLDQLRQDVAKVRTHPLIGERAKVEQFPRMEGRQMVMVMAPAKAVP